MKMTHIVLATSLVLPLCASVPVRAGQPGDAERLHALRLFSERIQDYAELHRRLEGPLPALTPSTQPLENYMARQMLATALRRARAGAGQGDVFTPAVSMVFRALIAAALSGHNMEALFRELNEEEPQLAHPQPVVNEPLPREATHEVPSVLLQALPGLPEDVEYRIVGRHLALWDIHANLVIDFLPNAFATAGTTDAR